MFNVSFQFLIPQSFQLFYGSSHFFLCKIVLDTLFQVVGKPFLHVRALHHCRKQFIAVQCILNASPLFCWGIVEIESCLHVIIEISPSSILPIFPIGVSRRIVTVHLNIILRPVPVGDIGFNGKILQKIVHIYHRRKFFEYSIICQIFRCISHQILVILLRLLFLTVQFCIRCIIPYGHDLIIAVTGSPIIGLHIDFVIDFLHPLTVVIDSIEVHSYRCHRLGIHTFDLTDQCLEQFFTKQGHCLICSIISQHQPLIGRLHFSCGFSYII